MAGEDSMDQEFIKKLTKILEVNLEKDQFGVNELTKEVGLSRTQLYRKLQFLTGKSASQFIREYRLQRAKEMLQNNVATASEIAYRVGFGSHTYFNTCFHDYYGYPPGEAKFRKPVVSEDSEGIQTSEQVYTDNKVTKTSRLRKKSSRQRMLLVASLGIVLILAFSYFFYFRSLENMTTQITETVTIDKSIAVLPFKNSSDDKTNEYFANGMMEDIRNNLSEIFDLLVISKQSSEKYRITTLTSKEIGKELSVNYLLEGTVQKLGNQVKIHAQLISAENEDHIWADTYLRDITDIKGVFKIQSEIAQAIAGELKIFLSPGELERIEKIPTNDLEAYNLYLTGRFLLNKGTVIDVKKSINYFEQSIEKDPDYALAYAGLASAYRFLTAPGFISHIEGIAKVREFALKSIELDSTLAEPHTTLGWVLFWMEWNWKEAEKELKLALKIDRNSVKAHIYYAQYLQHFRGHYIEAREHLNQAIILDPVSYQARKEMAIHYYYEGLYDKAHMEFERAIELNKYNTSPYWGLFYNYMKQRKYRKAVDVLKDIMSMNPTTIKQKEIIETIYEQSGIKGIFRWLIEIDELEISSKIFTQTFSTAEKYAFLGENEKALELLEKSFDMNIRFMVRLNNNFYFESLHSEPRFIALLNKMGLKEPVVQ
jgi:TolB-like protein/AraC-like DNA-binding protein/Tfp pilus assembly protein PilF